MTRVTTRLAGSSTVDRIVYHSVRGIVTAFCRTWCRMTVDGRHNVPAEGVFILAPTHRSIIDTPVSSGLTRRRMRFMGADKWWQHAALGKVLTACGGVPVTRGTADREALRRCISLLESGEPLVLFPEGERKSGPVVQPLFDGAAYIAAKTGAPIVPVGIGGSERAMRKGAKGIRPHKIHVVIGEPLDAPTGATPAEQRAEVRRVTASLHVELQRLLERAESIASAGRQQRPR